MEFTCPECGLVLDASERKGPRWIDEHRAKFHTFTTQVYPVEQLRAIAQDLATGHKWRNTLSVADCEFLHALEIDPT